VQATSAIDNRRSDVDEDSPRTTAAVRQELRDLVRHATAALEHALDDVDLALAHLRATNPAATSTVRTR
jgi:hypothetical protein